MNSYELDIANRVQRQLEDDYESRRVLLIIDMIDGVGGYDICGYIFNAEVKRKSEGLDKIDVAIVAHDGDPIRHTQAFIDASNFRHYAHNVWFEMIRLFQSIGNILFFDNRRAFIDFLNCSQNKYSIYPEDYSRNCPMEAHKQPAAYAEARSAQLIRNNTTLKPCMSPNMEHLLLVRKWMKMNLSHGEIPVSISLRECSWQEVRNANFVEWQKLIDHYKGSNIKFIVLRDYFKLYDPSIITGNNVIYYNEPVLLISFRAAVYQECVLNLFSDTGHATLAHNNMNVSYIQFKPPIPGTPSSIEGSTLCAGFEIGGGFHGATKYQKIIWDPCTVGNMVIHTNQMIDLLKEDRKWFYNMEDK